MSESDTQLLQQIVDLLRESAEYRRKSIGDAVDALKNRPDSKNHREESTRRMAEAMARSEERRREDLQHQVAVLAELKTITSLLQELCGGPAVPDNPALQRTGRAGTVPVIPTRLGARPAVEC